ncbi:MAG: ribonuclease HII [Opitutales bacterium]|nr:ribonuclease HII [Opitutales bacterium]
MVNPRWVFDRKDAKKVEGIVGVDEAGRGCLAGPVVAGAVILPSVFFQNARNREKTKDVNDSKQFDESKREFFYDLVRKLGDDGHLFWGVGTATVEEIEKENIVGATCLAMARAMEQASAHSNGLWEPVPKAEGNLFENPPDPHGTAWIVRVDGRPMKKLKYEHQGLVKGDTLSVAVAMASMMAKVTRDRHLRELALDFPAYDFSSNKGYGAPKHLAALKEKGLTVHHRPRFLRNILSSSAQSDKDGQQSQLSFD